MDLQVHLTANPRVRTYTVFTKGNVPSGRETTVMESLRGHYDGKTVIWTESRGIRARFIAEVPEDVSWEDFHKHLLPLLETVYQDTIGDIDIFKPV